MAIPTCMRLRVMARRHLENGHRENWKPMDQSMEELTTRVGYEATRRVEPVAPQDEDRGRTSASVFVTN